MIAVSHKLYHAALLLILILAMLALALLTESCTTSAVSSPTPAPEIGISESDLVQSVGLRRGQILAVDLAANPSTGYTWIVGLTPGVGYDDNAVLQPMGDSNFTPESPKVGAPGRMVLRFKALREGECELRLTYARPWESVQPLRSFAVKVTVQ